MGKALDVLELVARQGRPVRFAELLRLSPLPKATLYRLVKTLVNQGMLAQLPENGPYALGPRLARLAESSMRQVSMADIAGPHLDALARDTGLTAELAELDHGHVLCLDRRYGVGTAPGRDAGGRIAPAYCTAAGKAMLAFLPEDALDMVLRSQTFHRYTSATLASEAVLRQSLVRIRNRGHAIDRGEYEPGVLGIGMPVVGEGGRLVGAVSLSASVHQTDLDRLEAMVPQLASCVKAIAEEATNWTFSVEGTTETKGRQEWPVSF
ncbi:IclR family transcriptional regulator [Tropicimonas sp. IMCC34043]|uniref:IclR family transcriptional regulator n=1 Tax=Tropicimonas sp. IMCC34043 TaxID=2248760 RepID=UPI0018E50F29|nr:IclR family transcriptional regulator [Tropicimonas sp. IMCC34043]